MSTRSPRERGADRATAMDAAEIDAFLDHQRTLVLVSLRRDGSPVAHPLWFARVGDALYVNTRRESLKVRNVSRDSRFCAVAEAGESYFELRGVLARVSRIVKPDGLFYVGLYGGREFEGAWDEDYYEPKRFFCHYLDGDLCALVDGSQKTPFSSSPWLNDRAAQGAAADVQQRVSVEHW